ncbi:AlbA family DNA-binding domain-containing protein [Testudinibacter sp. TW-1]|uniref:AlbA family DNA-binding domain-containing protein n=1 Tax=Testudinibacter sp. TW-1 TaxID=3417757 RepID=UPI003D369D4D
MINLLESDAVEFKLAQGKSGLRELPIDFWKNYSAMANTYGGKIILGVHKIYCYRYREYRKSQN